MLESKYKDCALVGSVFVDYEVRTLVPGKRVLPLGLAGSLRLEEEAVDRLQ